MPESLNPREIRVEDKVCEFAEKHYGLTHIKLTPQGQRDFNDRLFFIPGGRPLLLEFKQPGEDLRAGQAFINKILKRLGYNVKTIDDIAEGRRAITEAMDAATVHARSSEAHPKGRGRRRVVSKTRDAED